VVALTPALRDVAELLWVRLQELAVVSANGPGG
jgi:hypothetical protein